MGNSFRKYNLRKATENNTIPVPFTYPGEKDTGEVLHLRSRHSDEYRNADMQAQRQISSLIAAAGSLEKADRELMEDIQMRAFCKLVAGWSFEEECNEENLMEFFEANPQAYDIVNTTCAQDTLFFAQPVKS